MEKIQAPESIIKKFNNFDTSTDKELEDFFSTHRNTIIGTEVGTIHEELDCRNWYRYEMEAAIMHSIYRLQLYRCDLQSLERHKAFLIPLTQKQKDICLHLLVSTPDFPFAEELLFTLENGWLEQESWR